ncbi:hypothetical protein, partial [Streptomyces pharetrae]
EPPHVRVPFVGRHRAGRGQGGGAMAAGLLLSERLPLGVCFAAVGVLAPLTGAVTVRPGR